LSRRAVPLLLAGQERFVAAEHAARYRDALGVALPPGLPEAFRRSPADPLGELLMRYARTHGPFPATAPATRLGLPPAAVETALHRLASEARLVEGAFLRGQTNREWCDAEVLRTIRRRSLALLRREVEPVEPPVLARFLTRWQQVLPAERRRGPDAVLDAVEKLQGVPLPASALEREILPSRVEGYLPGDLDALAAAGELVWVGVSPLGQRDGRVALYLTDWFPQLHFAVDASRLTLEPKERAIVDLLQKEGASFFAAIHDGTGGGFPQKTVEALWSLVWKGVCTNDTFRALRAFTREQARKSRNGRGDGGRGPALAAGGFRSRRMSPASAEGRWSLVTASRPAARDRVVADTERATALARQLLARYGLVSREVGAAEELPGGFSAVYEVLRTMDETGKIRRGYFVGGVAAMQFALPPVLDMLRGLRGRAEQPEVVTLLAADPANPYGALLPWPEGRRGPARAVGSHVVLVDGALAGWIARGGRQVLTFLPPDDPDRARVGGALAGALARLFGSAQQRQLLLVEIDDVKAIQHPLAEPLLAAGFATTYGGLQYRAPRELAAPPRTAGQDGAPVTARPPAAV
jgi:ATP-dependent Lhr-like helicase